MSQRNLFLSGLVVIAISVVLAAAVVRGLFAPTIAAVSAVTCKADAALAMVGGVSDAVVEAQQQMIRHLRGTKIRSEKIERRRQFEIASRREIVALKKSVAQHELNLRQLAKECRR